MKLKIERSFKSDYKTTIKIYRKDSTYRIITVEGLYNGILASQLGKDLEGENYLRSEIVNQ